MIEPKHRKISVRRQCQLLVLPRSSLYYLAQSESDEDLRLMREIDELHLLYPFFGSRQLTHWLRRQGEVINRKRMRRLMRLLDWRRSTANPTSHAPTPRTGPTRTFYED